jgi:hypothetical protein
MQLVNTDPSFARGPRVHIPILLTRTGGSILLDELLDELSSFEVG